MEERFFLYLKLETQLNELLFVVEVLVECSVKYHRGQKLLSTSAFLIFRVALLSMAASSLKRFSLSWLIHVQHCTIQCSSKSVSFSSIYNKQSHSVVITTKYQAFSVTVILQQQF